MSRGERSGGGVAPRISAASSVLASRRLMTGCSVLTTNGMPTNTRANVIPVKSFPLRENPNRFTSFPM